MHNGITDQRGFTLIEIVVIIVISGILLTSVGAVVIRDIVNSRVELAAIQISSDLGYARRMAMSSGLRHWVVFDQPNQQYTIYPEDTTSPGNRSTTAINNPLTQSPYCINLNQGEYSGVSLTAVNINGTAKVQFSSKGEPFDAASALLSSTAQITLNSTTGISIIPVSGVACRD